MRPLGIALLAILLGWPIPTVAEVVADIIPRPMATVSMDLPFRDEAGTSVTLRALAGAKPLVVVPVVHKCPNICSIELADLLQAISFQSLHLGEDFNLVALSIDPLEKPADAREALDQLRHASPDTSNEGLHALTGDGPSIRKITDELGYRYSWDLENQQYIHVAAAAVLSRDGRLVQWLYGLSPQAADLQKALSRAGTGRAGSWGDQFLLLCSHYERLSGRYSAAIMTVLRLGALGFCALIIALIVLACRRRWHEVDRG